ncbi:cation:proton antiporter [Frondihabitans cladoniiphilus]|uniref:Sodium:proton antiporter n=1 Tax=Frondihabitans cladoniiphilus TaxID=715785 RepID=A0ABP8VQN9_9MICO
MTALLIVIVLGFVVIAAATVVGPRLGIASPLVLVAVGVGASFVPVIGSTPIEPELILAGVLPPLLYSSAVSMPAMNFRREFGAISGLSVLLVVGSSLVLGLFFALVIPGLGFAWGVALGAIVSPTDAVATSIIKKTSVSKRVVALLDGESLLNDATALVLLRTAIVAVAATFSFWDAIGTFAYSVVVAVVIGLLVGWANLAVRKRVTDSTVNTVISFAVPFAASIPTGLFHGSGLVAAVVAGLVTGIRAPRDLSPQNRLSDSQNWRTVELVLEGAVFLVMGVQLKGILADVQNDHAGIAIAVLIAVGALVLTVAVRAAYIAPLLGVLKARSRHNEKMLPRFEGFQDRFDTPEGKREAFAEVNSRKRPVSDRQINVFARRVTTGLADIAYFRSQPLGWREGAAVVWAGMRGAVTVAAAQTLPTGTPQRSTLVLIAFAVAALSLLVQGGTIGPLLRVLAPKSDQAADEEDQATTERRRIIELMRSTRDQLPAITAPEGDPTPEFIRETQNRMRQSIDVQRAALLDARDNGTFDADVLAEVLANLDASQIAIEMRGRTLD